MVGRLASRRGRATLLGLAGAVAGSLGAAALAGIVELPSVGDALTDLSDALGAWTYLLVPVLALLETAAFVGLLVPGETAVLVGGVVAGRGEVSLVALIALVWAAAVAGDVTSFLLGRRLGAAFLRRHAVRLHMKVEHVERAERLFERHGGKSVVIGRFVGVLRAFTPFAAGTSGMTLRRFLPYSVGGALVWAASLTLAGYAFSSSVATAGELITRVTIGAMLAAGLVLGARHLRRRGTRGRRAGSLRLAPRPATPAA